MREARAWAKEVLKQRYQWMEMLFGKGEEKMTLERKSCRHPNACAMCRKHCPERMGDV